MHLWISTCLANALVRPHSPPSSSVLRSPNTVCNWLIRPLLNVYCPISLRSNSTTGSLAFDTSIQDEVGQAMRLCNVSKIFQFPALYLSEGKGKRRFTLLSMCAYNIIKYVYFIYRKIHAYFNAFYFFIRVCSISSNFDPVSTRVTKNIIHCYPISLFYHLIIIYDEPLCHPY